MARQSAEPNGLWGTAAAIATARVTYRRFKEIFGSERFRRLRAKGARIQRPLCASMSAKDPAYADVKYVEALIGPDTVATVPRETLTAMRDHLVVAPTLETGIDEAQEHLRRLQEIGIDIQEIYENLQREGVELFDRSYQEILHAFDDKREQLLAA